MFLIQVLYGLHSNFSYLIRVSVDRVLAVIIKIEIGIFSGVADGTLNKFAYNPFRTVHIVPLSCHEGCSE